jgi:hypothetical protein
MTSFPLRYLVSYFVRLCGENVLFTTKEHKGITKVHKDKKELSQRYEMTRLLILALCPEHCDIDYARSISLLKWSKK